MINSIITGLRRALEELTDSTKPVLVFGEKDILRKGIGWALKDNLRYQPERLLPYIKDLRRRRVSSTITLYGSRDLKGAEREAVLAIKAEN